MRTVRHATIVLLLATGGCIAGRAGSLSGSGGDHWLETLAQAEAAANEHRYAHADRLLADFATRYPESEGAIESSYWRGVIELEPANHDGSPQVAAALFETYNKAGGPLPHRVEADILRHLALRLEASTPTTVAATIPSAAVAAGGPAPDRSADLKAKDTEIQRLKDELAKANDELERIKRRLTAPTKP